VKPFEKGEGRRDTNRHPKKDLHERRLEMTLAYRSLEGGKTTTALGIYRIGTQVGSARCKKTGFDISEGSRNDYRGSQPKEIHGAKKRKARAKVIRLEKCPGKKGFRAGNVERGEQAPKEREKYSSINHRGEKGHSVVHKSFLTPLFSAIGNTLEKKDQRRKKRGIGTTKKLREKPHWKWFKTDPIFEKNPHQGRWDPPNHKGKKKKKTCRKYRTPKVREKQRSEGRRSG